MTEVTYDLKTPLAYQDGGSNTEANTVVLTAPSGREKKYSMRLKAGVMHASQMAAKQMPKLTEAEVKAKAEKEVKAKAEAIARGEKVDL